MITSCAPSKEFLLKRSSSIGIENGYIRVLIKKMDSRVMLFSKSRMKITEIDNREIKYNCKGRKIYFYPEKLKKSILIESWGSPICVDGKYYRGAIKLYNVLGKIYVINVVSMSEYLYSVVPSEISSSWDIEAIKAQAVAARTYAFYHFMKRRSMYDLDATINFQAYKGISVESGITKRAVDETCGKIVIFNNKPILAFFHSTCGGKTSDDKYVWNGDDKIYLCEVGCDYCKDSPHYQWKDKITLYEIRQLLKKRYGAVGIISDIVFRKKSGRICSVIIRHKNGNVRMTGNDFRLLFSQQRVKSLFFSATKVRDGLILHGHGWGHGVGMCQWGAKGMAEKGAGYKVILKHYYRGTRIIDTLRTRYARR
ncbi:MAG: SpoIID/LytB domain-containing protein [Spirochaetota bacterium]|nr:SpoIID/LytB domain-containing protein [Spirochaetota bacterium]